MKAAAASLPAEFDSAKFFTLHEGDCLKILPTFPRKSFRLIACDPPYNIGVDYHDGSGGKSDKLSPERYVKWCEDWLAEWADTLTADGSLWIVINDLWAAELVCACKKLGLAMRNWVKWFEGWGENCTEKFNRTSRHLLYFTASETRLRFERIRRRRHQLAGAAAIGRRLQRCPGGQG